MKFNLTILALAFVALLLAGFDETMTQDINDYTRARYDAVQAVNQ
jgi:hypothetical protein